MPEQNQENLPEVSDESSDKSVQPGDFVLAFFIDIVTKSPDGFTLGITLNVGGTLISGDLVSGKAYFEGLGEDYQSGFTDIAGFSQNFRDSIRSQFNEIGEVLYGSPKEEAQGGELTNKSPIVYHFIHLKNAKFFAPGASPTPRNRGTWWRGKIEAVDGFCLGSLSSES